MARSLIVILILYFIVYANTMRCFDTIFPRILGWEWYKTILTAFAFDSSENIVVGGGIMDVIYTDIDNVKDFNPIVALYEKRGNIKWAK